VLEAGRTAHRRVRRLDRSLVFSRRERRPRAGLASACACRAMRRRFGPGLRIPARWMAVREQTARSRRGRCICSASACPRRNRRIDLHRACDL